MSESALIDALEVSKDPMLAFCMKDPMLAFCVKVAIVSMTTIVAMFALLSVYVVVSGAWDMVRDWYERWSYTREVLCARKERENERRKTC